MRSLLYYKRDSVIKKFVSEIRKVPNITQVILFGSTAEGNDKPDSDIDIALIGKMHFIPYEMRSEINDIVTDFLLNDGVLINWIFVSEQSWKESQDIIIANIKKVGVKLWVKEKT
ncbi:MAG: nucleotidyltransferase domain-containing protein [Candidatus Hodarchaeales archaeon]